MFGKNESSLHIILVVVALVCFGFAAFAWTAVFEPYRSKLIAAGLFFLTLSTFFA